MTFIKQLREAARTCSNGNYKGKLAAASIIVDAAVSNLRSNATQENMQALNGAWANADRILKNVPPEADPSPTTGGTDPTRFAVAA